MPRRWPARNSCTVRSARANAPPATTPTGAQHANLLDRAFPETFYTSFDVKKYDLCFTCHEKQVTLVAKTTTLNQLPQRRAEPALSARQPRREGPQLPDLSRHSRQQPAEPHGQLGSVRGLELGDAAGLREEPTRAVVARPAAT
jgi:hypothetical protein